jgi:glutathione S-transferase
VGSIDQHSTDDAQAVFYQGRQRESFDASPLAKVPALVLDNGRVLTETLAICTYLEGIYPEPNLMGVDFEERA